MAKGEWEKTTQLIETAVGILEIENPMTIRQLFYRLVSVGTLANSRADYQRLSVVMSKARNDGRCDFDWIVDRSRPEYRPNVWKDAAGYGRTIQKSYRKDYWAMQPNHVELWSEKDSVIGSIEALTDELGITVRVGRGFLSTTRTHEIAKQFLGLGKPISVFYIGDHDPSGREIEDNARNRVKEYGVDFDLERLAIHAADITEWVLPPLRIKDSDTRAKQFRMDHGEDCVELDALPVSELRRRIEEAVESKMDSAAWDRAVAVEKIEIANIQDTVGKWNLSGNRTGVEIL
jgi:hypothetical protein